MPLLPVDSDGILIIFYDIFLHGLILIQLLAQLVEIADLQIRAQADAAGVRLEIAEKKAQ